MAQSFADKWRRELYSTDFKHPDIVHNAPTQAELDFLPIWERLDKKQRYKLVELVINAPHSDLPDLSDFGDLNDGNREFLKIAICWESYKEKMALLKERLINWGIVS